MCKQAKNKKKEFPKITASFTPVQEKENFALQDPLCHKDSTMFAVLKQIFIIGQPIHELEHVLSFIQLNSPTDVSEVTHVNNATNVFKHLEDWGQIQG